MLLLSTSNLVFGQTTSWEDTTYAPIDGLRIVKKASQLPDNVIEEQFWLQDTSTGDSTELVNARRHDLPSPNFFWLQSKYLIFENRSYDRNPRIHVMDLRSKEIEFTTDGMIPHQSILSQQFFDEENAVLVYFTSATDKQKTNLMKLNALEESTEKLTTFPTKFSYEYPTVTLNPKTREVTVQYTNEVSGKVYKNVLDY